MKSFANRGLLAGIVAAAAIVTMLAGCGPASSGGSGSSPPPVSAIMNSKMTCPSPKVADCGLMSVGSPQKFICDGKPFTSFDLSTMRIACERQQSSQQKREAETGELPTATKRGPVLSRAP